MILTHKFTNKSLKTKRQYKNIDKALNIRINFSSPLISKQVHAGNCSFSCNMQVQCPSYICNKKYMTLKTTVKIIYTVFSMRLIDFEQNGKLKFM